MSLFTFLRSEMARLMLAGFVVGTFAVGAINGTGALVDAAPITVAAR